ncbi:MAG: NADH:ubiquinone reductase (Na(+)-transporting) subunit B [Acidobacteriota bacterium]
MKFLRKFLDNHSRHYKKGGKLERFGPLFETVDFFLYTSGEVAKKPAFVRDALNLKRMMMIVVYALIPAVLFAFYNTGLQINAELAGAGKTAIEGWRAGIISFLGTGYDAQSLISNVTIGLLFFLPVYFISFAVGAAWEIIFGIIRKHEVSEGFLVTSLLFPMILPPGIPLWQVALGISFGIVIGKEVFGGVGMNIINPALAGRAFLFFAYPAQISGDAVWVAVDGVTKATPLAKFAENFPQPDVSWLDAFIGTIPGSMGETSAIACLIGAFILIATGIGSWRIMAGIMGGMVGLTLLLNLIGSSTNPMFSVTPEWHFVLGGFAFGMVFMATDPVSAAMTLRGKYYYGLLIGILVVLVRVINPAFPEGMMLAILFGNVFAPIIDRMVINKNIKRRLLRNGN